MRGLFCSVFECFTTSIIIPIWCVCFLYDFLLRFQQSFSHNTAFPKLITSTSGKLFLPPAHRPWTQIRESTYKILTGDRTVISDSRCRCSYKFSTVDSFTTHIQLCTINLQYEIVSVDIKDGVCWLYL